MALDIFSEASKELSLYVQTPEPTPTCSYYLLTCTHPADLDTTTHSPLPRPSTTASPSVS